MSLAVSTRHEANWGVMAEFATPEALLEAARRAHEAGFRHAEAYSPFPIEGLRDALGAPPDRVPMWTFIGGLLGGVGGFWLQWYAATVNYPINVGGRPLNSWPMFVPVTFEMIVLCGAFAAVLAMLIGNRHPRLYHPVFNVPEFSLASRNRFFLCLRRDDPGFDAGLATRLLDELEPLRRMEIPA